MPAEQSAGDTGERFLATLRVRTGSYAGSIAVLLTTVLGINVGYAAVFPFLPDVRTHLGLGAAGVAVFVGAFAVTKVGGQPLGGVLLQRWPARLIGALALGLAALGIGMVAWADTAEVAVAGRLLWGLGDGLVSPVLYRAISALSEQHGRDSAPAFAKLGVVAVLSFAAGPFLVAAVHHTADYPVVLTGAAVFTVLNAVVVWFVLTSAGDMGGPAATESAAALDVPSLLLFAGVDFGANLLWGAMEVLVPLYLAESLSDPTLWTSLVLGVGMTTFAVAGPLIARLPEAFRGPGTLPVSFAVLAAGTVALYGVTGRATAFAAVVVFMAAQAHVYLVARGGIERYCGGTGKAWGTFGAFSDAGFIVGPVLGALCFDAFHAGTFPLLGLGAGGAAVALSFALLRWKGGRIRA